MRAVIVYLMALIFVVSSLTAFSSKAAPRVSSTTIEAGTKEEANRKLMIGSGRSDLLKLPYQEMSGPEAQHAYISSMTAAKAVVDGAGNETGIAVKVEPYSLCFDFSNLPVLPQTESSNFKCLTFDENSVGRSGEM